MTKIVQFKTPNGANVQVNETKNADISPVIAPEKTISVVMVTYHTGPALLESISAILRDPTISELILVDNGNTDIARKSISDYIMNSDRVRLLQGHGNVGFAKGCNYGARLAKSEFILFLNPDAIISEGAALRMISASAGLKSPWLVGGLLRNSNGAEQRGSRRGELTPLSAFASFTGLHRFTGLKNVHKENEPLPAGPIAMPTVSGAMIMTNRQSFNLLGGFDESYFLHVEDIDICRRARLAGGDVYFTPKASAMHYGSTSNALVQSVEKQKLKGFIHYFKQMAETPFARARIYLLIPFMSVAIIGRAWWLALRKAWTPRR